MQLEFFEHDEILTRTGCDSPNPMVRAHGPGPDGAICGDCRHLYAKRYSRTYHKCELRGDTNGPATDHRVRWPACGRYEG